MTPVCRPTSSSSVGHDNKLANAQAYQLCIRTADIYTFSLVMCNYIIAVTATVHEVHVQLYNCICCSNILV